MPDITILLSLHREGILASFTLRALSETALHATAKGLTVELVATLDRPDATTRAVMAGFADPAFVRIEIVEVDNGSLGLSRNAGLAVARGHFVAIVDGDDLYPFNYLVAMHAVARGGARVVAHPGHVVWFDEDWLVQRFLSLARSGRFRLAGTHTFASCLMAPTGLLRDAGYRDCVGSRVFAYEDYDLLCRLVAAGADIRTAPETVLFYRRHGRSIMAQIGDAASRIGPSNAFFAPGVFAAAGDGDDVIENSAALTPDLLRYRSSRRLAELVLHAGAIDPRLALAKVRDAPIFSTAHFERGFGATYHDLCRRLAGRPFDVALVVERREDCPAALLQMVERGRCLVIEMASGVPARAAAPGDTSAAVALDAFAALPPSRRPEMAVRLVHGFAPDAPLHVGLGPTTHRLVDRFAEAFERNAIVLHDARAAAGPELDAPAAWTLSSEAFSAIDLIVSDDPARLDALVARIPLAAAKVMVLPEGDAHDAADAGLARIAARLPRKPKDARWTKS